MKFQRILTIIFTVFVVTKCDRLGGKGNTRGVVTKYAGLSPKQIMLLKIILKLRQDSKFGRFA